MTARNVSGPLLITFLTLFVTLATACGSPAGESTSGTASGDTELVVDARPAGNADTQIGEIEDCLRAEVGQTFDVDILVLNVKDLLAWEMEFVYYPSILEVAGRDVKFFSDGNAGSNVFDVSGSVPNTVGHYTVAAADIADPSAPDTGSGVLARVSLRAKSEGISPLAIPNLDLDSDGVADRGRVLTNIDGDRIDDDDGDGLFDGAVRNAQVAVGQACPSAAPPEFKEPVSIDEITSQ